MIGLVRGIRTYDGRLYTAATALVFGGFALTCLYSLVRTLDWPIVHDVPLLHYVSWRILSGDTPYKEVFENGLPGTYLIHMFVIKVFGKGDLSWRLFEIAWLSLSAGSMALYCSSFGRFGALIPGLFLVAHHLGGGPTQAGERDFVMLPFLILGGHFMARCLERGDGKRYLVVGGVLLGCATIIKAQAFALVLLLAALYVWNAYDQRHRDWLVGLAVFVGSAMIAPLSVLLWLIAIDAFPAFWHYLTEYLPLYVGLRRLSYASLLVKLAKGLVILSPALVTLPLLRWDTIYHARVRYSVLLLSILYGIVHFTIQAKGWKYHLYPLYTFFFVLAGIVLGQLMLTKARGIRVSALIALSLVLCPLGYRAVATAHADSSLDTIRPLVNRLVDDLSEYPLRKTDTVQVLDTTRGGIHALYTMGVRQPTRFITDFHFFHDEKSPVIMNMKSEFVDNLEIQRPRLIVVFHRDWLTGRRLNRFKTFPRFTEFLDRGYARRKIYKGNRGDGYTIYAARR